LIQLCLCQVLIGLSNSALHRGGTKGMHIVMNFLIASCRSWLDTCLDVLQLLNSFLKFPHGHFGPHIIQLGVFMGE
jgi:hypothetical protein